MSSYSLLDLVHPFVCKSYFVLILFSEQILAGIKMKSTFILAVFLISLCIFAVMAQDGGDFEDTISRDMEERKLENTLYRLLKRGKRINLYKIVIVFFFSSIFVYIFVYT